MTPTPETAAFRFGYGLPLPRNAAVTPQQMMAALAGPDVMREAFPGLTLDKLLPMRAHALELRGKVKGNPAARKRYAEAVDVVAAQANAQLRVTMARAVEARDGFRERLVRFWADHFTTTGRFRYDGALPYAMAEDAIRPHLTGRFADMLRAVTLHPSMLIYLDQVLSVGPNSDAGKSRRRGLNENLARELIELHTLGVGAGYTQDDVRQLAELLTGLVVDDRKGQVFRPELAEPGPETVLGKAYPGSGVNPILRVLDDLATRPETARHIARKLATHFVADRPKPALIDAMAQTFRASGGNLLEVYRTLLEHRQAWSEPLTKARQPYDFMVASFRAMGLGGQEILDLADGPFARMVMGPMKVMGQDLRIGPNGPDGWAEEAENWISPQGLAARITWAMEVPGRLKRDLPDPASFAKAALGNLATEPLLFAVRGSENQREGIGLVLASPAFNRR